MQAFGVARHATSLTAKFEAHDAPYTNAVTRLPLPQSLIQVYAYKLLPEGALSLQEPNKAIFLCLPTQAVTALLNRPPPINFKEPPPLRI
jgi:hypothetical protein